MLYPKIEGRALGFLKKNSFIRVKLYLMLSHSYYNWFIIAIIITSAI